MKRIWSSMSPIRRAVFTLGLLLFAIALLVPPRASADDCLSDPLNAADCMRTPGYRETITVIFSALPTLSSILPNVLGGGNGGTSTNGGGRQGETGDDQVKEKVVRYVVQVSSPSLTLTPEKNESLAIKAWKSVDGAPWTPASEVSLGITVSPDSPDVHITPRSGAAEMQVNLGCTEEAAPGIRNLTVTGAAPNSRTSAQVQVDVQTSPYELRISRPEFEILIGDSVELEVSCWRRDQTGMLVEEPDARIRPWLPTEKEFFEWDPPPPYSGAGRELYGRVFMTITAVNARQESELCYLDFTAIFPDRTEIDKRVNITLKSVEYQIEFL